MENDTEDTFLESMAYLRMVNVMSELTYPEDELPEPDDERLDLGGEA